MQGQYTVFTRMQDGSLNEMLPEYTRLHALLTLNEPGSWDIHSTSADKCPFYPGMGIVVARNGAHFFGGAAGSINDTLDAVKGLHNWSVSGVGDLGILSRRICYVDPATGSTTERSHYSDLGQLSEVVERLIRVNAGVDAMTARRDPMVMSNNAAAFGPEVSVSLRFQNLLDAVTILTTANGYNIRPVWSIEQKKVFFELFESRDMTHAVVFTEQLNNITESTYLANIPEGNFVLAGGKGEMTEREFSDAQNNASIIEWGRVEKFQDGRNQDDIVSYASETLGKLIEASSGYSVVASDIETAPQFGTDYQLGDYVSIKINGQFMTAQIRQVEINVENGIETVSPKFGTIAVGKFRDIFQRLGNLRQDVDELLGTEIP